MKNKLKKTALGTLMALIVAAVAQADSNPKELKWDDLSPPDFDLYEAQSKIFADYDIEKLQDGTPEAAEALQRVQALSDNAPVVKELAGTDVKIPGFVVPFEYQETVTRFLLVPYFGACIHTPAPPSNQIILVESETPIPMEKLRNAVYITGTLSIDKVSSEIATSSYRMSMTKIEPYD